MSSRMTKLGLGEGARNTTEPTTYSGSGDRSNMMSHEKKKLGLKTGGHAKDKNCKTKLAMGGVGKERLGMA